MFPQQQRRRGALALAAGVTLALTAACSSGSDDPATTPDPTGSSTDGAVAAPAGEITVLTWRTDLVEDGTFDRYVSEFKAKYPDVTDVKVEGITDYEGEVKTRMNTEDYGDVLAIVNTVNPDQLPDFFEPLGDQAAMSTEYRMLAPKSFEGKSYGIPVVGNTQGIVYNKKVWADAGITDLPTTPDEFLQDLKAIKDSAPDVDPLYTNYADGWPLTQWESHRGEISADPDFDNLFAQDDAPWAEGTDHYVIDSLLWDAVEQGLTEADPTTTSWEPSKNLLGTGKIGAMVLGSWAIVQMQQAATDSGGSADDIGYMPFPYQVDGTFHAIIGGDYNLGINVHSDNKVTARAWIDWFNHDSGFADDQGGISPLVDSQLPANLADFTAAGVEFIEMNPAPAGKESLLNDIDSAAEIGLWSPDYRKALVDNARGAGEGKSKQEYFDSLDAKWAAARATVAG
ncbi:ABC transporter substrate-binding protein [Cellulomonas composti]|uniref:Sugar ABC transporter substrate-binding protein n=1 Tax=Cellulomonas composti TaxID=266130 RepID=A0A511JC50_9CELL|nr:extracellular solute-binding protein [Cellulomonas composti]GEL95564.1 sugar ABC transporter substrate-binding protein [Cellulomonas composti]